MGILQDSVVIVTGAGRGIGREHALLLAAEGAKVVVNDRGGTPDGTGAEQAPANEVVAEIRDAGGDAIASVDDIATADGAEAVVSAAIEQFGTLNGLVNNAGILRDTVLFSMSDTDWETSLNVNLGGHFFPMRAAARYWREQAKAANPVRASIVNTSSESGIFGNAGQGNYAAAKAGVAALTEVASKELSRYGVRVNAICPRAVTRLTEALMPDVEASNPDSPWHPGNVSPWVAYLLSERCEINGQLFIVFGGVVQRAKPWSLDNEWKLKRKQRWQPADFAHAVAELGLPANEGRDTGGVR